MDRRTLTFLAIAIVLVMAVVAVSGKRGLSEAAKDLVASEAGTLESARDEHRTVEAEIGDLLSREPELFRSAALDVTLPERLAAIETDLTEAERRLAQAQAIVDENDRKREDEVFALFATAGAGAGTISADLLRLRDEARRRVDFKQNLDREIDRMREDHRVVAGTDLSRIDDVAERAAVDWPEKRTWVTTRLERARRLTAEADEAWALVEGERRKASGRDYEALIRASERLERHRDELPHVVEDLDTRIDQLYTSWDKVLADMDVRENGEVTFHHKYDVVKVSIEDMETHLNTTGKEEVWTPVSKDVYERFEGELGMTVERKAAGKFDDEAESVVQPAGLAYVASPEEGRNQYGHWRSGPGGSFWVFYGQYALMRDLFWGRGGYRPVGGGHWRDYDRARRSGRTFHGSTESGKPLYGSRGTVTATRYAGSKYRRTGGFQNTRYKQSGGTYRGSRYAGSGGRGGRASRGGSRFGGGK